ncbi:MAG: DUF2273 domain-containing protein [Clostridiales bacterium]|nr:DUF2273 domain-containing protein [Clostridiales bacterium]
MSKEMTRRVIGAAIGVGVGLMLLYLGFLRTLLLVALGALGYLLGEKRDWGTAIADFIARLRSPWH